MSKRIVIVGASFAGGSVANKLTAKKNHGLDVTLVDQRDFFEVNTAATRGVVDKDFGKTLGMKTSEWVDKRVGVNFVQGKVVSGTDESISTEDGKDIPYDILVIASGSSVTSPFKSSLNSLEERQAQLGEVADRIKAAGHVVFVGAGPTCVETAAEVLYAYPEKKVTIVTRSATILPTAIPKAQKTALGRLEKHKNFSLIVNDSFDLPEDPLSFKGDLTTKGGKTLAGVDVLLVGVGSRVNNEWIKNSEALSGILDDSGLVKVDQFLRVEGKPKIFALGDIANFSPGKLAYQATKDAPVVAANIEAVLAGKTPAKKSAPTPALMMFLAMGPKGGTASTPGGALPSFMVKMIKSSHLFVGKFKGDLTKPQK